jgi:hypothetical protein
VTKEEEVAECTTWRISRIGNPVGCGSGHFLLRPFGIVCWCIIQMQIDASKRLSALAVAEVPPDVREKRWTKKLRVTPRPRR